MPWVPVVYDTRLDRKSREFWILREYFQQVGWGGIKIQKPEDREFFARDLEKLRTLFRQVAVLHAYSGNRIDNLVKLFSGNEYHPGGLYPPSVIQRELPALIDDSAFLFQIGVTDDERRLLASYCEAVEKRPSWAGNWDVVCVTTDWKPENIGVRNPSQTDEIVIYDWSSTRLAPMEEEMFLMLRRLGTIENEVKKELVSYYLQVYADQTGHYIDRTEFMSRIPWARFFFKLRFIISHANALRWVPYQTRSREFIHLFIDLAGRALAECRN